MKEMRAATRKKRDAVLSAALQLFIDKGYENVSVDEIIEATGISKGTFYHYFHNKDRLLIEVSRKQIEIVERWSRMTPNHIHSLEDHINQLFLDLASSISTMPRVIRSLSAMQAQSSELQSEHRQYIRRLFDSIDRWLPETRQTNMLIATYLGTVSMWCMDGKANLHEMVDRNLSLAWAGLRHDPLESQRTSISIQREEPIMKVAVIGGGLAGLTAASYLSEHAGIEGVLFERSPQLGGRAFTYEKSGFTLNYGAHAIYGLDRHTISVIEKELGLSFSSKQVNNSMVMYEKNDTIAKAPLNFMNLVKTELLNTMQKVKFVGEITAIITNIHQLKNYATLGDYMAQSNADEDLKELWEHLVCSNFFIAPEDAREVPGSVISEYYQNLFLSQRPVNYILGSWAVITNQLRQKIESSGRWEISLREGVDSIQYDQGQFRLTTKNRELSFDKVIFAMPVQHAAKLLKSTPWEPFMAPYEQNSPTEVMVYDVGLRRIVARPFHYISDMNNKLFISDVSATDHTLVPEGGQLLQGIAYLSEESTRSEEERKAYLEERTAMMESLFDRHYPNWREEVEVKRVSKKAMVQSVKNMITNKHLPNRMENVPFYFCGDGCAGKGELAERAFSSGRNVAQMITAEVGEPTGV